MPSIDYIKSNSVRYNKYCSSAKFQSYNRNNFGQVINISTPNTCLVNRELRNQQYKFDKYVLKQQDLYQMMRLYPEKFPLISTTYTNNLTPAQQRIYSNMWYRQFGTSQAMPVNDNWGGFYLVGSEVPYTN